MRLADRKVLPGQGTLAYHLLALTAVCGEFPAGLIGRLPGSVSYKSTVIWMLKKEKLLRTYYQDGLRGYRLGRRAKRLLLEEEPGRFDFHLTGKGDTNMLKSEVQRRLRLHRIAGSYVAMGNAGVAVFRDEKPHVFAEGEARAPCPEGAAFYSSREVKEMGIDTVKIRSSRMTGVLLTPSGVFLVYNGGPCGAKWDYRAEQRAQTFLKMVLCCQRFPGRYGGMEVSGLLFGDGLEPFYSILTDGDSQTRCFFLLDGNYGHFYYLTNDHRGDVLLRLLCDTGRKAELDRILMQGLCEKDDGFVVENDAMDENGNPVLFGYVLDIPRINRFCTALQLQDRRGTIICFDFQKEALACFCSGQVELSAISFEKFERRFFP